MIACQFWNSAVFAVGLAVAWIGHGGLVLFVLNRIYAQPWPRYLLRSVRLFLGLVVLALPVLWWSLWGWNMPAPRVYSHAAWPVFGVAYIGICMVLGVVAVPCALVLKWRLRKPGVLRSNHTETVDVPAELGWRPLGRGQHRWMVGLPGNDIFRVDCNVKTVSLHGLPSAWDGLSILHLSDLHLRGIPDKAFYAHILERCQRWQPDLVALTGDVVDSHHHHRWIVPLLGRLRWRIAAFAVLGNHDYYHDPLLVRRRLRRVGFHVLGNRWTQLDVHGLPLIVVGHEGPWFCPEPDLSSCPAGPFRLCLSHTPDNLPWCQRHGIGLMLAGHNHGGQIRLPGIGSLFVPSTFGRRYDAGLFDEPPTLLHVSRGLAGKQPLRINCRPEVSLLVLKRTEI
ncbi:MAG: metallophosphoesterase [Gemmataceae bacterium]